MAASSSLIADMLTAINAGPTAATIAKAIAAAGPINDYVGNCKTVRQLLQEASVKITLVDRVLDAGDGIKATVATVKAALGGTSSPSTTLITDMTTVIGTGPAAASKALAIAAAGPIQDIDGMLSAIRATLVDARRLLALVQSSTDSSDTSKTQIDSVMEALA